jgi:hypothetical protein
MSSRLRKAYVAAKFCELGHRWARARHSEAAAACSSGFGARGVVLLADNNRTSGSSSLTDFCPLNGGFRATRALPLSPDKAAT